MNQPKPRESLHGEKCPICGKGILQLVRTNYEYKHPDEPVVNVPDVWIECCDQCGEQIFPSETSQYIERFIAEQAEQLTPDELEEIRLALDVDQTEMSQILGLGEKTFHRWENGTQFPNRSMCYYIRVLAQFPEAFEWLRERGWRRSNRVAPILAALDLASQFPDLADKLVAERGRSPAVELSINPARGLTRVAFIRK
jgi:putative zinc finger/helix-turn-helix YgiT family protein